MSPVGGEDSPPPTGGGGSGSGGSSVGTVVTYSADLGSVVLVRGEILMLMRGQAVS